MAKPRGPQSDQICIAEIEWSSRGDRFCTRAARPGEDYCGIHLRYMEHEKAYRILVRSLVDEAFGCTR